MVIGFTPIDTASYTTTSKDATINSIIPPYYTFEPDDPDNNDTRPRDPIPPLNIFRSINGYKFRKQLKLFKTWTTSLRMNFLFILKAQYFKIKHQKLLKYSST